MMRPVQVFVLLLPAMLAGGCQRQSDMTLADAAGATVSGVLESPFTLVDGRYEGAAFDTTASSRPVVRLLAGPGLVADVNSDGDAEAVVILVSSFGGSGSYVFLAVVDAVDDGAKTVAIAPLGDRIRVESLSFEDRVIRARMLAHGPDDALCCPTIRQLREWLFEGGALQEPGEPLTIARHIGHALFVDDTRTFRPCGSDRDAWLVDRTDGDLAGLAERLTVAPDRSLFIDVDGAVGPGPDEGPGAGYETALTVFAVRRAEREGFGCREALADYVFRAFGNEPGWQLRVTGPALELAVTGSESVRVGNALITASDNLFRIAGHSEQGAIEAEIARARCVDSMSGSMFEHGARVRFGDSEFVGCAIRGLQPVE